MFNTIFRRQRAALGTTRMGISTAATLVYGCARVEKAGQTEKSQVTTCQYVMTSYLWRGWTRVQFSPHHCCRIVFRAFALRHNAKVGKLDKKTPRKWLPRNTPCPACPACVHLSNCRKSLPVNTVVKNPEKSQCGRMATMYHPHVPHILPQIPAILLLYLVVQGISIFLTTALANIDLRQIN